MKQKEKYIDSQEKRDYDRFINHLSHLQTGLEILATEENITSNTEQWCNQHLDEMLELFKEYFNRVVDEKYQDDETLEEIENGSV